MEAAQPIDGIESILRQVNQSLAPQDRVPESQIKSVGTELSNLLTTTTQNPGCNGRATPLPRSTLRARLAAFWAELKRKLSQWLSPINPRWRKLMNVLKSKLQQLEGRSGHNALMAAVLVVVVVAVVAALIKSIPLLVALLAILGVVSLVRLLNSATRLPLALCAI